MPDCQEISKGCVELRLNDVLGPVKLQFWYHVMSGKKKTPLILLNGVLLEIIQNVTQVCVGLHVAITNRVTLW